MIFSWNSYWKPTPAKVRKVADAVVAITTALGSYVTMDGKSTLGVVIFITGYVAKMVSNFFTE